MLIVLPIGGDDLNDHHICILVADADAVSVERSSSGWSTTAGP
jgi:hypothetical protein